MKRSLKKSLTAILVVALALTSVFAFSGCSSKKEESTNPNDVPSLEGLSPYSYSQDGKPNGYYKNEFNDKNQCISTKNYTTKGSYLGMTEKEYDDNGNVILVTNYDRDNKVSYKLSYEYDSKNRETKCSTLNPDGSVKSYSERIYEGDLQTEWKNCNADGSIIQRYVYGFDDKGNCTKITRYGADGKVDSYTTYEDKDGKTYEKTYDSNDNLIDEDSYDTTDNNTDKANTSSKEEKSE